MEVQTNKRMQLYTWMIRVFYAIVMLCNLIFPVYNDGFLHPGIFGIAIMWVWTFGFLCANGLFRKVVSEENEDGQIRSEIQIPYIQVAIIRIVELSYSFIGALDKTNFRVLVILIVLDAIYVVILLMYKSSYYYVSEPFKEEEELK